MDDQHSCGEDNDVETQNGRRLLRLIEFTPDRAIFLLDPDGIITSWNKGGAQLLGYASDEIIGQPFTRLLAGTDESLPAKLLRETREERRHLSSQIFLRRDGSRFRGELAVQATLNETNTFEGFAVGIRDITQRRQAEAAIKESERKFRLLVEGVTDYAIFMLDLGGRVTNWNAGARTIKGYAAEEIIGRHFSCFYTAEDCAAGVPEAVLETVRATGHAAAEGWRVRKDGSRFWASVVIDVIRDETGAIIGFAKVTRDNTKRQELQQALEQAREQLFQAQKLEAVGNLTGGIAHDFNNLLTIMRGSVELAERHATGNERLRQLLAAVQGAVGRAAELTHQMLAFSRRQPLRPELLDLPNQLLETSGFLDRSLRGDIRTTLDVPADLWPVELDPRQFELALLNIGLNARDAMPAGGCLWISAANVTLDGGRLGLAGHFVRLAIADEGVGIPPHLLEKVIEPFFTTKEVGKGSGLGLSQAYGFAQQSGGTLTIDSTQGKGTTVTLYLPARIEMLLGLIPAAPKRPQAQRKGTVLVVEDDLVVAELAVAALEDQGYTVSMVHCAPDALEALEAGTRFDLVFSDIIMPGRMNGVELAQTIRVRYPHIPVLLTTGYSAAAVSDAARSFPLITKPYKLRDLTERISRIFEMHES